MSDLLKKFNKASKSGLAYEFENAASLDDDNLDIDTNAVDWTMDHEDNITLDNMAEDTGPKGLPLHTKTKDELTLTGFLMSQSKVNIIKAMGQMLTAKSVFYKTKNCDFIDGLIEGYRLAESVITAELYNSDHRLLSEIKSEMVEMKRAQENLSDTLDQVASSVQLIVAEHDTKMTQLESAYKSVKAEKTPFAMFKENYSEEAGPRHSDIWQKLHELPLAVREALLADATLTTTDSLYNRVIKIQEETKNKEKIRKEAVGIIKNATFEDKSIFVKNLSLLKDEARHKIYSAIVEKGTVTPSFIAAVRSFKKQQGSQK
uniref:P protein n=1 Tax=Apis rhabdovirus 1 TaxID=1983567 RepID=A0A1W6R6G4_9RHAB|nr:P protein [Apis rhabdovirus 1]